MKWNLIDFYIGFHGFLRFLILIAEERAKESGERRTSRSAARRSQMGKFNLSLRVNGNLKARYLGKFSVSGFDAFAIFIISTCVPEQLKNGGWEIIG